MCSKLGVQPAGEESLLGFAPPNTSVPPAPPILTTIRKKRRDVEFRRRITLPTCSKFIQGIPLPPFNAAVLETKGMLQAASRSSSSLASMPCSSESTHLLKSVL